MKTKSKKTLMKRKMCEVCVCTALLKEDIKECDFSQVGEYENCIYAVRLCDGIKVCESYAAIQESKKKGGLK